ncbi:hypothetical protein BUALT_Bualt01G0241800 [Buddleja alternifolia]|uniref:Dof zinc finger protein n=1 Tax=Buddleja alternifolia TaxID=168488 RepID=A0AAV6YFH2_9LAMI|nr:hypothetical protein BUALT_Bualt01G0241800 [Buddleja alternifolia]
MDSARWTQEFGVAKSIGELGAAPSACTRPETIEKKLVRPQKDQVVNCPRCHSTNTKFCYYNNYSLTQPRYFCKTCRRYWTAGGTLRNVPVGGGSRKNKKSISNNPSSSLSSNSSHNQLPHDLNRPNNISHFSSQNPKNHDQGQDLNLGYNHGIPQFIDFPKIENRSAINSSPSTNSSSSNTPFSAVDFLRNGIAARGLNSFIPMAPNLENNTLFSSGFPFQESKPVFSFSVDGINNGNRFDSNSNNNVSQENSNNGTLVFPFGAMKRYSSTSETHDQVKGQQENSNGYWNGMLGGGGSNW